MKKTIALLSIVILVGVLSFQQQPKIYKVQADIVTWEAIITVIDLSVADPKTRVAVKELIIKQLNDTTLNK